ncbi:unnamed protein product [Cladocopium goreaui]|uniref:ATP-dependent helicase C-terminal domain-containing protein n=1 Tax=Cladocopium goreaui TaxID=2562237 RepID=A0A9P1D0R7_9DINO|nr:unnamed protein product [Cladocopium goreaui]
MLQGLRRRFIDHGLEGRTNVDEGWAVRSSVPWGETVLALFFCAPAPRACSLLCRAGVNRAVNEMAPWQMDSFLRKMSLILEEGGQGSYTLTVSKAGFGQRGRLSMVALSGAIAFQGAVARCRSVLFASGTLAPFALFKRELGLGQELEGTSLFTRPVVADEVGQCSSVTRRLKTFAFASLEGQKLSSTRSFRAQQLPQYLTAVGKVFKELLPVVPHGKLVFFPSHEQLNDAVSHWRSTGLLERHQLLGLERFCGIPVVVESSGLSSEAAASLVTHYRQLAAQPEGAVLLAVMRGRCAEGADFKDDAARAVVVVGVPFPSMDTEVKLKMEYEGHNGSAWYEAEAYRSVSQAAGRLLRHQNDYGALLLLDGRFTAQPAQLSGWLRHELRQQSCRGNLTMAILRTIAEEMTHFFLRNEAAELAVHRPKMAQQHLEIPKENPPFRMPPMARFGATAALLFIFGRVQATDATCRAEACFDDEEGKQMRLELLQRRVEMSPHPGHRSKSREEKVPAVISSMYTFGAPAVSRPAMPDLNQADHCFRGLRTYTENKLAGGGRQVDAASMFDAYAHPTISTLALDWGQDCGENGRTPSINPAPEKLRGPKEEGLPTGACTLRLTMRRAFRRPVCLSFAQLKEFSSYWSSKATLIEAVTIDGVKMATEEPFKTANEMVTLAYKSYDSVPNTIKDDYAAAWRICLWFVGFVASRTVETLSVCVAFQLQLDIAKAMEF